jgi:hypothetical protein
MMKITLDVQLIPDYGINVDVQPDDAMTNMSASEQEAIVNEAIRALEHYIIMISHPQEDA